MIVQWLHDSGFIVGLLLNITIIHSQLYLSITKSIYDCMTIVLLSQENIM